MPSDDYVSVGGGGALKLKGAKVNKKKKKKSSKSDLEKNLGSGSSSSSSSKAITKKDDDANDDHEDNGDAPGRYKTETERRYEEARKKKVRKTVTALPSASLSHADNTQLLQVAEQSGSRPELLKTHKERVEELNTYLSKLSEHHDMPKIGPG